jgi:hypothetical protein
MLEHVKEKEDAYSEISLCTNAAETSMPVPIPRNKETIAATDVGRVLVVPGESSPMRYARSARKVDPDVTLVNPFDGFELPLTAATWTWPCSTW